MKQNQNLIATINHQRTYGSNFITILDVFHNFLLSNWPLKSLLTSIKRTVGTPPDQKLPITAVILLLIHVTLNFMLSFDFFFWAICLVAFYGTLHKAHLLPTSPSKFDSSKQLTKADFRFFPWDTLIVICWSKAIHFVKGWSNPSPLYSQ